MVINRGQAIRLLLVAVILVASVWYALHNVEWDDLWGAILNLNPLWVIASIAATLLSHVIRAERWRLMIPDGRSIPLIDTLSATLIGYFMNDLIPRSGEVIRPYTLARRQGRPFSSLVATVVVERTLDGLSLVMLFVLLVFIASDKFAELLPGYSTSEVLAAVAVPVVVLAGVLVAALYTSLGDTMIRFFGRWLPDRVTTRLTGILHNFRTGITFGGTGGAIRIAVWTVVMWCTYALALYFGFLAFNFDTRFGLGLSASIPLLAVTAVAITVAPTPGAIGVYHTATRATLTGLFGVAASPAVAFALVMHAIGYLSVLISGAGFMLRENLSFAEATRRSAGETSDVDVLEEHEADAEYEMEAVGGEPLR